MLRSVFTRLLALAFVLASLAAAGPAGHAGEGRDCCNDMAPATAETAGDCCATPAHDAESCGAGCLAMAAIAPVVDRMPTTDPPHCGAAPAASPGGPPPGPDPAPPKRSFPV